MADADYFLDLSSPDPLADDVPSSARPASRRITKSQLDLPSLAIPQSSPRRGSRAQSPRKRTFQLDVGDERSPQRIRVTVEAEEALKHTAVNRKLFPSASPTRSPRRRETITTTSVPLNDEAEPVDGDVGTPRKRGRPRRTSNGTPMPRGRKRAGTPIQRKSKQARREDGLSSEAGVLDDASTGLSGDGDQDTPKPKTRTRRTPRKSSANTPAISSQISSGASGRKRGRPRKVPIHEEPTVTTEGGPGGDRVSSELVDDRNADPSPDPPERDNGMASLLHPSSPQDRTNGDGISSSPSSHHEFLENDDFVMDEGYEGTEPQSDLRSAESEDGLTHHRQDTIADASDFSMIAVESLPSFQASFQASFRSIIDQPASDQHEMGEETSRIINETLDSLRRSLQTETESSSHAADAENGLKRIEEERDEMQDQSAVSTDHSGRAFSKSPRRPKHLPLSRKVFVGRGNIDDSFSTIPDSILHAATPGRLSMKPIVSEHEHGQYGGEDGPFEDSFSEIPEAVLEAATPRPTRHVETSVHGSPTRNEELYQTTRPTARRSSPDYGSNRLPTPEETSSSNAGSRKAHEEETGLEPQDQPGSVHRADVPSSPPIRTRPRALDFGYSNLQHELNLVQGRRSSSPPRLPLGANAVNQPQTLEAPLRSTRPSLSPIVRAGRTLQNVMSDNSSPEGRERNLGSPFKGASGSDCPHQSSVARSPSPSIRKRASINKSHLSVGSPTPLDRSFRSHLGRNLVRAPQSSSGAGDPFSQDNITHSRTESLRDLTSQQSYNSGSAGHGSTAASSSQVDPANIDGHMSWAAHSNSSQRMSHRQSPFQTANSHGQETVETRSQIATQVATTDDTEVPSEQDHDFYDKQVQDMDENRTDEFEGEHVNGDIDDDDDVDIWDVEASRASPTKPELAQNPARTLKSDAPPSRRSKVPSPWRRNNRRLIYKDDIASSSQIEIEESSQSELEQYPPIRSRQRALASQPQQESDNQRRGPDPEPAQESSAKKQLHEREVTVSPNPSHDSFGEYARPADSDDADFPVEDEELIAPSQPHGVSDSVHEDHMDEDHEELVEQNEQEDLDMPPAPEASNDVSEYSMVALQAKQTPKVPEKVAPSKSKLFGKFDILSFFSSPATLPTNKSPGPNPPRPADNASTLQSTLETKKPKEPPIALWSTGLFPPLPQNDARASSGRGTNAFSSGSALQSTDTIADTYEPSTSVSPSPSRSLSQSAAPSTPERQVFPPIKQKQNFTPRQGGPRGSLFALNQGSSSATQGEAYDDDLRQSSEEQESSALTEGSDYERVPPREKPSQWDRNLSPTKSCFRSPLKPTTPGRIVSFSNSALPPLAQVQTQNTLQNNAKTQNTISQGPPLRPTLEGKENQLHPHTQQIIDANSNSLDKPAPTVSAAPPETQQPPPPPAATSAEAPPVALSQTTWSKQHWRYLDEILSLRRRDPRLFHQVHALPPRDRRPSAALLGKEVSARGERLLLDHWHLEVVEAFRLAVGGWDERVLAKRVFALVIGDELRRAGIVR